MNLENYQNVWAKKKVLRLIYQEYYSIISSHCIDGSILEIGGGIGNFDIKGRKIYKTDIQYSNSVELVCDAHYLPFGDSKFDNIVLIDVLHHLDCPINFLKEAGRVLSPNGKIIMLEPGITPISWLLYKIGHEEDVDMSWIPNLNCLPKKDKNPYEANQAIPTLIFNKYSQIVESLNLKIIRKSWLSLFVYPLSGGFQNWSLIPSKFVIFLLKLEDKLLPLLGSLMAFRLIVVLENNK